MVALLSTMVLVGVLNGQVTSGTVVPDSGVLLTMATIAAVGLVVAWHQPGNPIGWLLLAVALCFVTAFNAGGYVTLVYHHGHRGPAAQVAAQRGHGLRGRGRALAGRHLVPVGDHDARLRGAARGHRGSGS